jgi:hypothetical protein
MVMLYKVLTLCDVSNGGVCLWKVLTLWMFLVVVTMEGTYIMGCGAVKFTLLVLKRNILPPSSG